MVFWVETSWAETGSSLCREEVLLLVLSSIGFSALVLKSQNSSEFSWISNVYPMTLIHSLPDSHTLSILLEYFSLYKLHSCFPVVVVHSISPLSLPLLVRTSPSRLVEGLFNVRSSILPNLVSALLSWFCIPERQRIILCVCEDRCNPTNLVFSLDYTNHWPFVEWLSPSIIAHCLACCLRHPFLFYLFIYRFILLFSLLIF